MQQVAQMAKVETLGTLARELGVAKSTVSRALRNDPRISKVTRERVLACAEKSGFQMHPYVQVLMAQRRMQQQVAAHANLVYLNDYGSMEDFEDRPLAGGIFEAAKVRAQQRGWNLRVEFIRKDDFEGREVGRRLDRQGVMGIIMGRRLELASKVPETLMSFSLISDGRYWGDEGLDRVTFNGVDMFSRLLSRLFVEGAGRVGIFMPRHLMSGGLGTISETIELLRMTGDSVVVLSPNVDSADDLKREMKERGVDALLFQQREKRGWVVKMLERGGFTGRVAEYCPPTEDVLPWLSATIPTEQIGHTLADRLIEKVCGSEKGFSEVPQVVSFQGRVREPFEV